MIGSCSDFDVERLIAAWIDGRITASESATLQQELRESATTRATFRRFAWLDAGLRELADCVSPFDETSYESQRAKRYEVLSNKTGAYGFHYKRFAKYALAAAAVVAIAVLSQNVLFRTQDKAAIATLVSVRGAVQWIGADGRMNKEIQSGHSLEAGTMECLSLDASAQLQFNDGSMLMLHGPAELSISAHDQQSQKVVTLREGNLSADVSKQPAGKPMLVRTPTAVLQVLGTQFDVAADDSQTTVSVREGLVRTTRLTDGKSVDVAAAQRAVASIDGNGDLQAVVVRQAANSWKSDLARDVAHGKHLSAEQILGTALRKSLSAGLMTADEVKRAYEERLPHLPTTGGSVYATPMRIEENDQPSVIYVVSLAVERGTSGPIQLIEGSRFRVRGSVRQPSEVTFGLSAVTHDRVFGKRFMKLLSASQVDSEFDIELPIDTFHGDDDRPYGLELVNFFCFASSRAAVLEINNVELIAP